MRREQVIGQGFPIGKAEDVETFANKKAQSQLNMVGVSGGGCHNERQALVCTCCFCSRQCAGATVKVAPGGFGRFREF